MVAFTYLDPKLCGSVEFGNNPLWYNIVYYYITMTAQRFLYYVVFCITDCTCIAAGLGYNGKDKDGNDKWDTICGIYILEIELGTSPVEMFRYWNH